MKSKIFKPLLITIAIVTGLHSLGMAQTMTAEQQKDLENRMKQMELKLQNMQVKMDSMKKTDSLRLRGRAIGYGTSLYTSPRAIKVTPRTPATPRTPVVTMVAPVKPLSPMAYSKGFGESFSKNMSFSFEASDKKLEERIKSGEVKEVTKVYSKSYNIDRDDKLTVNNKFGKVIVNTWNKNEFKVDVQIKADAIESDEAQKLLDGVKIEDSKDGSTVSFATKIESNDGNNSWGTGTNNGKPFVRKVSINYTIYMPSKNALQISNSFGGIELPDFEGKLTVNGSYSNLTAKKLSNTANDINNRFGNTTIESLTGSQLKINYGSLTLGTGDNLNADISMASAKVSKLRSAANISTRYGSLQLSDLDKNLKSLSVKSNFTNVSVDVANNQNFDFDVTVTNTTFDYGNHDITVTSTSPDNDTRRWTPTKNYKGHLGKGDAEKLLTIKASYGVVKFNLQ